MESQQIQHFEKQGLSLIEQAKAIRIVDQPTREQASAFSAAAAKFIKERKDFFAEPKRKADEAHKEICKRESMLIAPCQEAKKIVDAELSRDALEQKRLEEEAKRKAKAEADKLEREKRERLEAKALQQMEKGQFEKAEATLEQAGQVFVPVVVPSMPEPIKTIKTSAGSSTMISDLVVELVDVKQVCKAVADGILPPSCVEVKLGEIKKQAKAYGRKDYPGVRIAETMRVANKTAA